MSTRLPCGSGSKVAWKKEYLIRLYFEAVAKDGYVFDRKYFENDLNFHRLRAEVDKAYYGEQLKRIKADPQYAEQLEKEIRARWEKMNLTRKGTSKNFKEVELKGVYSLRGKNREFAIKKGLPICYDKLALLATSIFKLSHWRCDVTVASYMLA